MATAVYKSTAALSIGMLALIGMLWDLYNPWASFEKVLNQAKEPNARFVTELISQQRIVSP